MAQNFISSEPKPIQEIAIYVENSSTFEIGDDNSVFRSLELTPVALLVWILVHLDALPLAAGLIAKWRCG